MYVYVQIITYVRKSSRKEHPRSDLVVVVQKMRQVTNATLDAIFLFPISYSRLTDIIIIVIIITIRIAVTIVIGGGLDIPIPRSGQTRIH